MTTMIGYLRVSTDEQSASGLGLDAQRETIQRYAERHGWDIVWYEDAGFSGKDQNRPALQEALARLWPKKRDVDGIVVAKLDRLSRSVHDFSGLLKQATARRWSVVAIDLGVDTTTAAGELVANVMMSVAQWERRVIGARTSDAMQAAKHSGKHVGRVAAPLPDATAERMLALHAEGLSPNRIATALNDEGVTTAHGSRWYTSTVTAALARLTDPTKEHSAAPAA
ncbi:recombinase family protein [Microbacterium enclense]|uniref:recombinase family protein n=1 Tax=Microbacterium enclense TaxID=993073 RepID=UPI003F81DD6A